MSPQISIITPWLDHPEFIEDYERATRADGVEVIIIDNASSSANARALVQMVERLGGKYIRNEENRWFSAANNQGLAPASGSIVVFLNNDIAGDPAWLESVRTDVGERGLFGPTLCSKRIDQFSLTYLEGWCIAATRETWKALGGWNDRAFQMPYGEDVELSLRATRMGVELKQVKWPITHKVNGTSYEMLAIGEGLKRNMGTLSAMLKGEAAPVAASKQAAPEPALPGTYRNLGRLADAQRDYRDVLERHPDRAHLWLNYGIVLRDCGRYEASLDALRKAIELAPALAINAYTEMGVTFDRANRFDEAVEAMKQVARLWPQSTGVYSNLAASLTRAGRPAEAAEAAREAVRLDPSFPQAHAELAHALLQQGQLQDAMKEAQAAVGLRSENVLARYVLGCVYKRTGRRAEALEEFDRALAVDPLNDAVAHERRDLLSRAP